MARRSNAARRDASAAWRREGIRSQPLSGPSERGPALRRDLDPPALDNDRDDAPPAGHLEQLGHHLGVLADVDLAHGRAARGELRPLGSAVRTAGLGVEEDRRRGHHGISVDAMRVAAALNMPPSPWQRASAAPTTCRGPHSPRSCRTASTSVNMPYMPLCVYESPPPVVFIGKEPPGAGRWPGTNAPPSPSLQKPSASRAMIGTMVKASYTWATSMSPGVTPAIAKARSPAMRAASQRAKSGIWLTMTWVDASPVPST